MRTRRHKLQVSTFPFLAVLLCAMGSLILFLLVMDRRARAVARAKLHDTRTEQQAQLAAQQAAKQAEVEADYQRQLQQLEQAREEQRRRIHAALLSQYEDLQAQAKAMASRLGQADLKVQEMQAGADAARALLTQYQKDLAVWQSALAQRKQRADQSQKLAAPSKADLERLTLEVVELEAALREIRERKRREKDTYSLVPYKGRRGEQRQPIYVECAPDGLVFHPDRAQLSGPQLTAEALRAEIERRVGGILRTQALSGKNGDERAPYLLFLVRPNSIETYYRVLSLIPDDSVAFGYELIDAHWVLDFSSEVPIPELASESSASTQAKDTPRGGSAARSGSPGPWPAGVGPGASAKPVLEAPGSAGEPGLGTASGGTGPPSASPTADNLNLVPGGPASASAAPGKGIWPNGSPSARPATEGIAPLPGQIGMPSGAGGPKLGAAGAVPGSAPGPASAGGGESVRPPGTESKTFGRGPLLPGEVNPDRGPFIPGGAQGFESSNEPSTLTKGKAPGSKGSLVPGSSQREGNGTAAGQKGTGPLAAGAHEGSSRDPKAPVGPHASLGTPAVNHDRPADGPTSAQQSGARTPAASKSSGENKGQPVSEGVETAAQPPPEDRPTRGSPGEADGPESLDVLAKLAPAGPVGPKVSRTPRPPLVLSHVLGNRDFLITVLCKYDHVVVQPGGTMYPVGAKNQAAVDEAFRKNLKQMIDRRQATVRPGEPPFRPMIHFQVAPDGLRSYFAMYPLLEPLQVPMTRENLESPGK